MKTICNPVPQKDLCLPVIEDGNVKSWQSIVLFEHILDGERFLTSPETNKLLRYFYGQAKPSVARTNYSDDLQFWAGFGPSFFRFSFVQFITKVNVAGCPK